ncbi:MAG: hypothetical protein BZ138_02085 [Methanosphaera sp. rholeuAM270]|nr:MAG: hypothetical protein BZ138_02085 [Methanosphaera sp. rholeuAM270]
MNRDSITIKEKDLNEYILTNFREGALVEISYNRVFVPGIIVNIYDDASMTLQLKGNLLNQRVDVNISEVKKEIVEILYTYENKSITIIVED